MQDTVQERLLQYQPIGVHDKTLPILDTFRKYLPLDGRGNICNDVLQCVSDEELRALSQNLLTAILIPSEPSDS